MQWLSTVAPLLAAAPSFRLITNSLMRSIHTGMRNTGQRTSKAAIKHLLALPYKGRPGPGLGFCRGTKDITESYITPSTSPALAQHLSARPHVGA